MRYLKSYNEAKDFNPYPNKYTPLIDKFINNVLEYKSDKFVDFKLDTKDWVAREGYPDRKTVSFLNKILNKRETISFEDQTSLTNQRVRVFFNSSFSHDIPIGDISGFHRTHDGKGIDKGERSLSVIFKLISERSDNVNNHYRQMEIVYNTIGKISEEEVIENFADILDLSDSYNISEFKRGDIMTAWNLHIKFARKICNLQNPGLEIVLDGDNQSMVQDLISATNRIKDKGILTSVTFGEKEMEIRLNAIDPVSGKKIG